MDIVFFCLVQSVTDKWILTFPGLIIDLSIHPLSSVSFSSCIFKPCYFARTRLCLLGVPGEWTIYYIIKKRSPLPLGIYLVLKFVFPEINIVFLVSNAYCFHYIIFLILLLSSFLSLCTKYIFGILLHS